MSNTRRLILGFLYRTAVCLCLFLLFALVHRFWPGGAAQFKEGLFYQVNFGELMRGLGELGRCVLPG